jgi:hypothetical protein
VTLNNLINENGEIDPIVYRAFVHRRCMGEYGAVTPRSLRNAIRHYAEIIPILQNRWREAHGLPRVPLCTVTIHPYGRQREGVRMAQF